MTFGANLERKVEDLLQRIPNYRGYRAKEDRRDADRRVREHLVRVYNAQADRIERVARDLAAQRRIQEVGAVDDFARTLKHFIDRVRTATSGYGGLFSDRDVDEVALDQLRRFDESLLGGADELEAPITQLEQAAASGGDLKAPAAAGTALVRKLVRRWDLRDEVIETAQPAQAESVLRALKPTTPTTPSSAFALAQGHALSVGDEDYIVDARIEVDTEDGGFRLFRLKKAEAEQWLYVPRASGESLALVTPTTEPYVPGAQATIGEITYGQAAAGAGDGELSGEGGSSGQREVRFTLLAGATDDQARAVVLDWGNERQVLVGAEVDATDVEIYGAPAVNP